MKLSGRRIQYNDPVAGHDSCYRKKIVEEKKLKNIGAKCVISPNAVFTIYIPED